MRLRLLVLAALFWHGGSLFAGEENTSLSLSAANGSAEAALLSRAEKANTDLYANLESFVCLEQIERFRSDGQRSRGHHLDSISGRLSFENGLERYSDLRLKDQPLATMASLEGAWSEGEFGTLIKQTEQLLRTQDPEFDEWMQMGGLPAAHYHFDVTETNSPWDLEVSARHYTIPFRTDVWISSASGEILKIVRASKNIPYELHIDEIKWGVTLSAVTLNGGSWLLPRSGDYTVVYAGRKREWNTMTFSDYHRYGSEIAVRFN